MIGLADEVMEQSLLDSEGVWPPPVQRPGPNFWFPESKFLIISLTAVRGKVLGSWYSWED